MQIRGLRDVLLKHRQSHIVACLHAEQLMTLISGFRNNARQVGTQRFDVRLHPGARAAFSPQQSFRKLCRAGSLALGPNDERLAQHLLPLSKRAPQIPIGASQYLRRMADRPDFQDCTQQVKQRIAERRTALLAGLEGIAQMQAKGGFGVDRNFAVPHLKPRNLAIYCAANCTRGAEFEPSRNVASRLGVNGVWMKQLLAVNLIASYDALPFGRDQPVDELLT